MVVGQKIAKYDNESLLDGLYVYKDNVFASIIGVVRCNKAAAYYV